MIISSFKQCKRVGTPGEGVHLWIHCVSRGNQGSLQWTRDVASGKAGLTGHAVGLTGSHVAGQVPQGV